MHISYPMIINLPIFQLPCSLAPMIEYIATGSIVFGGSSIKMTLKVYTVMEKHQRTKWMTNFATDRYFELLKKASVNVQMEVVTWDKCEKSVRAVPEKQGCTGINNILNQDLPLVP